MLSQSTQQPTLTAQPGQVLAPVPLAAEDADSLLEVLAPKKAGGSTFHAKVHATGAVYRFEPARYPREPRFWCVSVSRCMPGGNPDPSEPVWIGEAGLSWNELAATMNAIRADLMRWLGEPCRQDLRRWMLGAA